MLGSEYSISALEQILGCERGFRPAKKNGTSGPSIAMTSSEERTSAEAEGYRTERALMDCVAPPF